MTTNLLIDWMCNLATTDFVPISMATTTTREPVQISRFRWGLHQYRNGECADHVKSIADDITANPNHLDATPVIVVRANDYMTLADGHHRTLAGKRAKLTHVPAIIYDVVLPADITDDDFYAKTDLLAMELAAHYNRHDKMPLKWSNADKKRLGLAMLAAQPNLSDIELSKRTGGVVSNVSFANYRKTNPELQTDTRTTAAGRVISAAAIGGHQPRKTEQPKTLAPAPVTPEPTAEPKTLTPTPPAVAATLDIQTAPPAIDPERAELMDYVALLYPTALDTVPAGAPIVEYLRECINIAVDRATAGMVPAPAPKPDGPTKSFTAVMKTIGDHDGTPASLNQLLKRNLAARRKNMSETEWDTVAAAAQAKNLTVA